MSRANRIALLGLLCSPCFAAQPLPLHQAPLSAIEDYHLNQMARTAMMQPKAKQLVDKTRPNAKGFKQYQQFYYGFRVLGGEVTQRDGKISTVSGQVFQSIDIKPETLQALANGPNPQLALASVKEEFLRTHPNIDWELSNPHTELVIKMMNQVAVPAIRVHFNANAKDHTPIYFHAYVKAEPPFTILTAWNNVQYFSDTGPGGNDRTGIFHYGMRTMPSLDVTQQGSECLMMNDSSQYRVVDIRGHMDETSIGVPYLFAFSYHCGDSNRDSNPYFGAGSPDDDAYFNTQLVLDLFSDWYNDRPLIDYIIVRTHYDLPYFGSYPMANAFYESIFNTINLGDGSLPETQQNSDSVGFYPLTSPDVIAHEFGHGYTAQHSGLVYAEESGALNEAFSDMTGITMMEYLRQKQKNVYKNNYHSSKIIWSMGSSIMRSSDPNAALRYLDQPSKDGVSADCWDKSLITDGSCKIDYQDVVTFAQTQSNDPEEQQNIIVHLASGIYNHWFYLLANTPGWTIKKAYALALKANGQSYWQSNTDLQQAACSTVEAVGNNTRDQNDVSQAFIQVGISMDSC